VEEVRCFDHDLSAAQELAERAAAKGLRSFVADSCRAAALGADLVVTATTAREAFLGLDDILPGTFIAAVGADNPHKAEIKGELMAAARVIPDLRSQASSMGDSRAAVAAGAISLDDLEVELADLVLGRSLGRKSDEEITIFDSTGTAALDLMAAQAIFEAAGL
jgi:alanine dehydrogenase